MNNSVKNKNKINQYYKLNFNNTVKNSKINKDIHFNLNNLLMNQKLTDNNRINIIINNNVNNSNNTNNNTINNKNDFGNQSFQEYYKSMPISQKNVPNINISNKKIFNNNNIYENENKSLNYINKIPINNKKKKENKNIIPHITKPIKKNYFLQTYDNINDIKLDDDIQYSNLDKIKNMNNIMNFNNKIQNFTKRKLLEYTPLYYNTQNNNNNTFINQQNNNIHNRMNSNKNINVNVNVNENILKIIPLKKKNLIRTSPQNYNKNKTNNYKKPFNENNINFRSKIHKNYFSNDLYSYDLSRQNIMQNRQNPLDINNNQNKRIYIPFNGTLKNRHSSPFNSKSTFSLGNNNNNIKKMIRNRSISSHRKQCFNFNCDFSDEQINMYHIPKNINQLNSNVNVNNYIGSKCYNSKHL